MTKAQLTASRTLWRSREEYRYRKWKFYRYNSKRPQAERLELRRKWWKLYEEARELRRKRDRQLRSMAITQVDKEGLAHVMREEGLVLHPYNDSAGHATIGVGHLLHKGGVTDADRRKWRGFDRTDAMALLNKDLDRFEAAVRSVTKRSKVPIGQRQFNALVSLAFNIGAGGFTTSTVARKLIAGDRMGAADAILMWDNPPELRPRRERERKLFLS